MTVGTTHRRPPRRPPPTGTIAFLFSDIEGSTRILRHLGRGYEAVLEQHRRALRRAFQEHGGWEAGTEGDSFFVTFERPADAVAAAVDAQRALAACTWPDGVELRVRIGIHAGEGRFTDSGYVGLDVHRAARIGAAAHGGQVIVSDAVRSLATGDASLRVTWRELGEHWLKDLPAPEVLFQVVADGLVESFPPIRSLGGSAGGLPAQLTTFVGRDAELAIARDLLATERLVTVTGPGGTGKTRFAVELARTVADTYPGGVSFVPLAALRDASLMPVEILRALRLDVAAASAPRDRVIEYFRDRRALLVLDNLEQLSGAETIVADLLHGARDLRIVVASQAALRIAGERELPLAPLPAPEPAEPAIGDRELEVIRASPAVQLFVDRARAVRPDFTLEAANAEAVVALCRRLDGLPLAIELAAAQVRLLSPAAILGRLGDRLTTLPGRVDLPERQRTLRAAVEWSYSLLSDPEQRLVRWLSVFRGGARLDEIERLTAPAGSDEPGSARPATADEGRLLELLGILGGLVDRSLVRVEQVGGDDDRFTMLETIREVASELLRDAGEAPTASARHAAIFAALAAAAEPEFYRSDRRRWLDRVAADHDNIRAALDTFERDGDLASAMTMCGELWRFWQQRGHLVEGGARVKRLLARADATPGVDLVALSRAEEAAGSIGYWERTQNEAVEPHYVRSLELARRAGDRGREAWALYNLAFAYDFIHFDDPEGPAVASRLRNEALAIFRELGDRRGIAESLWAIGGNPVLLLNRPREARERLLEAIAALEAAENTNGLSWAFLSVAMAEAILGDTDAARRMTLRAGALFLADGDLPGQLVSVQSLASLLARAGRDGEAIRLQAAVAVGNHDIGVEPPEIPPMSGPLREAASRLTPEELTREREAGRGLSYQAILREALAGREGQ